MPLSERTYYGPSCGLGMDRDLKATRNIAMLADSPSESENAGGGRRSMPAMAGASRGIRNSASSVLVTNA